MAGKTQLSFPDLLLVHQPSQPLLNTPVGVVFILSSPTLYSSRGGIQLFIFSSPIVVTSVAGPYYFYTDPDPYP